MENNTEVSLTKKGKVIKLILRILAALVSVSALVWIYMGFDFMFRGAISFSGIPVLILGGVILLLTCPIVLRYNSKTIRRLTGILAFSIYLILGRLDKYLYKTLELEKTSFLYFIFSILMIFIPIIVAYFFYKFVSEYIIKTTLPAAGRLSSAENDTDALLTKKGKTAKHFIRFAAAVISVLLLLAVFITPFIFSSIPTNGSELKFFLIFFALILGCITFFLVFSVAWDYNTRTIKLFTGVMAYYICLLINKKATPFLDSRFGITSPLHTIFFLISLIAAYYFYKFVSKYIIKITLPENNQKNGAK